MGVITHLQTLIWTLLAQLLLLLAELVLGWWNRFGVRAWAGFGGVLVIDHIGLRIVLLFCTHGINLGRT
jgi:hypothetical protein